MDILLEFVLEVIFGGIFDGINDEEIPKGVRIGCLIFASLAYLILSGIFVWVFLSTNDAIMKWVSGGVILLFGVAFFKMWRKVIKSKK